MGRGGNDVPVRVFGQADCGDDPSWPSPCNLHSTWDCRLIARRNLPPWDLRARRRGPVPKPVDPRVQQLEAENRRLQRKLQRAETVITLPKKVAEILGIPLKPLDNDETD